jgi:hypothetical protein
VPAGALRIEGWVLADSGPVEDVVLIVGEEPGARPVLGLSRPDVGEVFSSIPHAGVSGFRCDVDLRASEPGPLRIDLIARNGDAGWHPVAATEILVRGRDTSTGRRPRAAFTIAQDEPVMLPLWLDYYGRYFEPEDLYVLDHGGGIQAGSGQCRVVPVHREVSFDHRWLRGTVEAFQAFLLQSYDSVLFAEADEFVVADPRRYRGLDHYIESLDAPAARCLGFNVVHYPDEPSIRFDAPLLAQRRYWHASQHYCKRLLSRVPLRWSEGFHLEYNLGEDPPDPALMLVHLHLIDYHWCLQRHRSVAARNWNPADVASGAAGHWWLDDDEFERWFRSGPPVQSPRELIPEHVRRVL